MVGGAEAGEVGRFRGAVGEGGDVVELTPVGGVVQPGHPTGAVAGSHAVGELGAGPVGQGEC